MKVGDKVILKEWSWSVWNEHFKPFIGKEATLTKSHITVRGEQAWYIEVDGKTIAFS